MKKLTFFLIIVISCLFLTASRPPSFEGADYRIYVEKSDKKVKYKVHDFYSVYYVYMNVIRALDVYDRLSERDIFNVITIIIDNLKKRNVVQLQLDNHKGSGTLKVTLRPDIDPKGKPILWLISNYNVHTKQVVSGDDQKDAYGTFYFISENKLVKYQYVFEPKSDDELKKMSANNRADYYLLDGNPGNDRLGRDILMKASEKADAPDRAVVYMTLSEYYLLFGKIEKARQCIEKARSIVDSLKDKKRKSSLSKGLPYANDLYKYYVKYTGHSQT